MSDVLRGREGGGEVKGGKNRHIGARTDFNFKEGTGREGKKGRRKINR